MADVVEQVETPDILINNAAVTFLRPSTSSPRGGRLMLEIARARAAAFHQLAIPGMRERTQGGWS